MYDVILVRISCYQEKGVKLLQGNSISPSQKTIRQESFSFISFVQTQTHVQYAQCGISLGLHVCQSGVYRTTDEFWDTDSFFFLIPGMITQNKRQEYKEKLKSVKMVKQKVFSGVLRHAESGLNSRLALLLHGVSVTFLSQLMTLVCRFSKAKRQVLW